MESSQAAFEWEPAPLPCAQPHRSLSDLLLVAGSVVVFFLLSTQLELAERLNHWVYLYERWQLDEIPLTLLVLSLGLVWFGWRRWRELRREIQLRTEAEAGNLRMFAHNRRLAQQLIQMQEAERRHIARELHDEVGQCCVAIQFDAVLIAREAATAQASIRVGAERISAMANQLQAVLRGMLNRLRPTGLDELGLLSGVQLFIDSWQARNGIACAFHGADALPALGALDEACTITLYRGVQEGLTNIARHARASQASVSLEQLQHGTGVQQICLSVRDNGIGLQAGAASSGLGVLGMKERVHALGGQLSLARLPAGGTELRLLLPMPELATGLAP